MDKIIAYGEFAPDIADFNHPGLTVCENVVAQGTGYSAIRSIETGSSNGLDARAKGAISATYGSTTEDFASDGTKIYRVTSHAGAWSDVSKAGSAPVYSGGDWVDFAQYGNEVIAVNGGASGNDLPQVWTLGTSSNFADLGGTPPRAATVAAVRDFVVVGHTHDATDGEVPFRVRWSGFGNSASWAPSAATQADFQDLKSSGGPIKKIIGGETGYIFQDKSIWQMTYEGPPTIWRFNEIAPGIGTPAPKSVVQYGNAVYFMSWDGFYQLAGGQLTPIGRGKVDRTVFANLASSDIGDVIGVANKEFQCITWFYDADLSTGASLTKGITYSIKSGQWSEVNTANAGFGVGINYAYSSKLKGDAEVPFFFFVNDHSLRTLTGGGTTQVRFDTGQIQFAPARWTTVTEVRPLMNHKGGLVTKQLKMQSTGTQDFIGGASPPNLGTAKTYDANVGAFMCLDNSRYHIFSLELRATTRPLEIAGLDIRFFVQGRR